MALSASKADYAVEPVGHRYSAVAIILHWVIAIAIAFQLVGGKWMVSAGAEANENVFTIFQVHKTVGLTILALTIARIIWRLANPTPALPAGMTGWEIMAAKGAHIGFYALLIVLPLTGWAMASVSPTGVPTLFALLEALPFAHLPYGDLSLEARHTVEGVFKSAHYYLSYVMAGLIVLHIAAALKHQFIAHDNLIARMVLSARTSPIRPGKVSTACVALGAGAAFLAVGIAWGLGQRVAPTSTSASVVSEAAPASAEAWVIDHAASTLGFAITFTGASVDGTIGSWSGDIVFDRDALDEATAVITIDTGSIAIANPMLSPQAGGSDGFDTANHPTAIYEATAFSENEDGTYTAQGTLTMRGVTVDAPVAFTFDEADGVATVEGSAQLNRLDFGIGAVGAADEAWLMHAVTVTFSLVASQP